MANIKEQLLNTLNELETKDLKLFQWHLNNGVEGFPAIPKSQLEKSDRPDTVDKVVQKYGQDKAVEITLIILKKMNHNQLAETLRTKHSENKNTGCHRNSSCHHTKMDNSFKQEADETRLGKDAALLKTENDEHVFKFCYESNTYVVTCKTSVTVLEALLKNSSFKQFYDKNEQKYVVIRREETPRGAVTSDFPCCLIHENEVLDITFIKTDKNSSTTNQTTITQSDMTNPHNFVTFNIKTKDGKGIRKLMKIKELTRQEVEDVCVYAIKGEKIKKALKRDGRFENVIFEKRCALSDQDNKDITNMSNTVDHLHGKHFQVIVLDNQPHSPDSSQEFEPVKNEPFDVSKSPQSENAGAVSIQQQESSNITQIQDQKIPDSEEILNLLRDQFQGFLKKLNEGARLIELQSIIREEYDKSAQSFNEIKIIKQLMKLSDSVCKIKVEGCGRGTGFLLFDRFILTNAHVVGPRVPVTLNLQNRITAVFEFEDLELPVNEIMPVKERIPGKERIPLELPVNETPVSYYYGKNDMGLHLDFVLLELSSEAKLPGCPELLSRYSTPPLRGGICIVGHPDGGDKKMDPCFIIPKEAVHSSADRHVAENKDFFHVITQTCYKEKWQVQDSQITYNSCFFHGSSGSPVFDKFCNLIGVHTGGYAYKGAGGKTRSVMEYAFPMLPILVCIITQCRQSGRSDVIQRFESQNNTKYVLCMANTNQQNQVI
ncbi:protein FAM111A-like isoform X2 [Electrophorus electricus]|uniref:protein FAM111A-like isoform X2 n=1 Tax=Electrophorus electricus TaxID=8005 RepID=UPI0015D07D69|nr:protein FAM111A-like isoform X2 [Electrophorus electricus]